MIGEGTKIDNLVQIGHNVVIGRHCVIVARCGISGSTELGDFVVMGGQSGTVGHIKIGTGAQIARRLASDARCAAGRPHGRYARRSRCAECGREHGLDQAARRSATRTATTAAKGRARAD